MISLEDSNPFSPSSGGVTFVGRTILVSSRGSASGQRENWTYHCLTIQQALSVAQAGDTIVIAPGTYNCNSNIALDGVSFTTLGPVVLNYTGNNFLFDLAGFSLPFVLDGDFTIVIGEDGAGCFNLPSPIAFRCRYSLIDLSGGFGFRIEGNAWPDIYIQGDVIQRLPDSESFWIACSNTMVNVISNLTVLDDTRGVYLAGLGLRMSWSGNIINTSTDPLTYLVFVASVSSATFSGSLQTTFVGKCLQIDGSGGSVTVSGFIRGAVLDTVSSFNENGLASLYLGGELYGGYLGQGKLKTVLSGDCSGIIVLSSPNSYVTLNGNFTRAAFQCFDVSAGYLIVNGDCVRTTPLPSSVTGTGKVDINGRWMVDVPAYLNFKGMIYLGDSGILRLSGSLANYAVGIATSVIHYVSGTLILHGCSLHVDGGSPPIVCPLASSPLPVLVYGCVENVDSISPKAQVLDISIDTDTDPKYGVILDGNPYTYTTNPGDTTSDIATAMGALIAVDVAYVVTVLANVITVTAAVPGVAIAYAPDFGTLTISDVVINHAGITNLITGTVIITDPDVV